MSLSNRQTKHSTTLLDASGRTVTKRRYIGDAVIDDGKLTMQLFDGGYLDTAGNAYYYYNRLAGQHNGRGRRGGQQK